jgi:hypothetical protein
LRPKWTELYAARRRQRNAASRLPELPDTLFGWIPVLHRITDEEVLQSAGLDAYVVCSRPRENTVQLTVTDLRVGLVLVFFQVCDSILTRRLYFRCRNHPPHTL